MTAVEHLRFAHSTGATVLAPPRHLSDACAADRAGVSGCKACADVCPHDALRFTSGGPRIDGDACRRCSACTAACPVGAVERAYLPDEELLGLVATAARERPRVLILSCDHDAPAAAGVDSDGTIQLALPCVQLVSDDLLLLALLSGAGSVRVAPSVSCPHGPHRQSERAVMSARETIRVRGWDPSRIELTAAERVAGTAPLALDPKPPVFPNPPPVPDLGGRRFERRMSLLKALGTGERSQDDTAASDAVPWRRPIVNEDKCTICGSWAFVCPTGALRLGEGGSALYGRESACIGRELCSHACPEDALALLPVVPLDDQPRLLARSEIKGCIRCGRPLLPEKLVRRIENKLLRADAADRAVLRLCESCKGTQMFEAAAAKPNLPEKASLPTIAEPSDRVEEGSPRDGDGDLTRRNFLKKSARVAFGAAVLAGCSAASETGKPKHRYGMVIDTKRCVGCEACVIACKAENKTPPGVNYILVTNNTLGERPDDKPLFTAKPCFHCEHPPCVDVCPVSATFKRKQDGIVVVDYDRCIGCRYCQTACPYGARFFDFGENYHAETTKGAYNPPSPEYNQYRLRTHGASPVGNVRKCTFCMHLQDEKGEYDKNAGRWPACAKTCTGHAIHFGDFMDPDSGVSQLVRERQPVRLKDELGAEPNVVYPL